MTSGQYWKELQCFARKFSNTLKKIGIYRVNCSQARIFQSKISIRNAFNAKSTSLRPYERQTWVVNQIIYARPK